MRLLLESEEEFQRKRRVARTLLDLRSRFKRVQYFCFLSDGGNGNCIVWLDMKATVVDLRYKMKEVLSALARTEEVTVLHRGQVTGKLVPLGKASPMGVEDHPMFGSSVQDESSVGAVMNDLSPSILGLSLGRLTCWIDHSSRLSRKKLDW